MNWLGQWWQTDVIDGHKGPLLLSLIAFVVTFLLTRTITRLIRAGKGPFHNVSDGGVHLHHSTPGIVLLVIGAFVSVGTLGDGFPAYAGALLVGVGASLVLDEFAMIFHLQDVYWSQEGQLSVNVVTLTAVCVLLAVVGVSPTSAGLSGTESTVRGGIVIALVAHLVFVVTTALKGKYPTALIGTFLAPLTWVAAVRLARPTSPWARRFYSPDRTARAATRAQAFDARWVPVRQRWDDFIGGTPSRPNPSAEPAVRAEPPT